MVDQPRSPVTKKPRVKGTLTLPETLPGMNKIKPNEAAIKGRGDKVGPDIPADQDDKKGSKDEDLKVLERMRKRMERCVAAESENRKAAVDDRKFKAGHQWPADVAAQRNTDKRPCLTNNRMKTFVHQITNPARENRPAINISPVGSRSDKEAAKMYKGLIRAIERDSHADIAYDTALDDAVTSGWGYMRLLTEWKSENSFDQVLVIRRVRNPFTVYLDPDRQEPDGSDARYGFVTEIIPEDEFKLEYPNAQMIPFELGGQGEKYKAWISKEGIRVAEYYEIVQKPKRLVSLSTGYVGLWDELDEVTQARVDRGMVDIIEDRETYERKVMYYKATAIEVLESNEWIGHWVPLIQVIGDEVDVEGKVVLSGIIRDAKDAQRMANYWDAICIDTPIPTIDGWKTMGNIAVGDTIFNETGEPTRVKGKGPVHLFRECYRITFDDGESIVADAKHKWPVETRGRRKAAGHEWRSEIVPTGELTPDKHFIYVTKPVECAEAELPMDPYFLGLWLGDGNASDAALTVGASDEDEIRGVLAGRGLPVGRKRNYGGPHSAFTVHDQFGRLRSLGLFGNKHVPAMYLRGSFDQRLDLLQGLMDTDGSIDGKGQCSFSTITPGIAHGFAELLRTLGIKAVHTMRLGRICALPQGGFAEQADMWQFSFTPPSEFPIFKRKAKVAFQLRARKTHPRRTKRFRIKSVERVPSVPVQCIAVDSPSHLYLAGRGMVPTHNTMITEFVALAPKAPYIMEEGQLEGHEQEWKTANTRSRPVLTYKGTSVEGQAAPPPQRQGPPGVPDGVVVAKQQAEQNMIATTGIRFDATMNERMNDESGKAIRELGRHTDIGAFHYYDNFRRSLEFLGRQIVQAIPKVYNRKQVVTILREDDTEQNVTLDPNLSQPYKEMQGSKGVQRIFNPAYGEYGVTVDIGPSYATKRQEASESMMDFVKSMPQTAQLVMDLIASEMDWPGAEKIAARLAKAIPPQFLTADLKDIPPQIQALIQNLEAQSKQLTLQLQQAMKALQDKAADRDVKLQAIESTLEAKILTLLAKSDDSAKKIAAEQARATADIIMTEMRERRAETHDHALAHHEHILGRAAAEHDHELQLDTMAHEPEPEPSPAGAKADG